MSGFDVCMALGNVVKELREDSPNWTSIEEACRSALVASDASIHEADIEQLVTFCKRRDADALRSGALRVLLVIGESAKRPWRDRT